MKNILSLLLLAAMLVCCASCKDGVFVIDWDEESPSGEEYADNYIYTVLGSVLYRISPYSASCVPMCPDPLCFHDNYSCPFYGVGGNDIKMAGKYLYYLKSGEKQNIFEQGYKTLCLFDRESGKFEVIYEAEEGSIEDLYLTDEYAFFNLTYLDKEYKYTHDICRFDRKSRTVKIMTNEPIEESVHVYADEGERIYWSDDFSNAYYSTDMNYQNRIDGDRTYSNNASMGEYHYDLETIGYYGDTYEYCFKLTAINTVTGETKFISDTLACVPVLYNGKLIYAKHGASKYLGLYLSEDSKEPRKYYDHRGGKFYICDADGSNERLLCDLEGTSCAVPLYADMVGNNGVGDWIAIDAYGYTEPDENGIIERDENVILLINIVSGEVKVAEIEKRN